MLVGLIILALQISYGVILMSSSVSGIPACCTIVALLLVKSQVNMLLFSSSHYL